MSVATVTVNEFFQRLIDMLEAQISSSEGTVAVAVQTFPESAVQICINVYRNRYARVRRRRLQSSAKESILVEIFIVKSNGGRTSLHRKRFSLPGLVFSQLLSNRRLNKIVEYKNTIMTVLRAEAVKYVDVENNINLLKASLMKQFACSSVKVYGSSGYTFVYDDFHMEIDLSKDLKVGRIVLTSPLTMVDLSNEFWKLFRSLPSEEGERRVGRMLRLKESGKSVDAPEEEA
jgi:hypothetical protein